MSCTFRNQEDGIKFMYLKRVQELRILDLVHGIGHMICHLVNPGELHQVHVSQAGAGASNPSFGYVAWVT